MSHRTPRELNAADYSPDAEMTEGLVAQAEREILATRHHNIIHRAAAEAEQVWMREIERLKSKIKAKDKALKIYAEYVKLLGDEIREAGGLAYTQGWRSSRIEKGQELRKRLEQVLKEASDDPMGQAPNCLRRSHERPIRCSHPEVYRLDPVGRTKKDYRTDLQSTQSRG